MYQTYTASWQSSLTGGWSQPPVYTGYYWEQTLGGGFWTAGFDWNTDGDVAGIGCISGQYSVFTYFMILGNVAGLGFIAGDYYIPGVIRVSGDINGIGCISSKYNFGRQKAVYPELRINDTYLTQDCPIAALEFVGFSPNKIVNIISYEDDIYENTESFFTIETLEKEDSSFPLKHYSYSDSVSGQLNFLITNITNAQQGGAPLFYQYELLFDAALDENAGAVTLYKNNELLVSKDNYLIQTSYDLVVDSGRYTTTEWGTIDENQSVHRIRLLFPVEFYDPNSYYVVTYKKYIYGSVTEHKELVSLVPVYSSSDFSVNLDGVTLTPTSSIDPTTEVLYITKDPKDKISPIGIEPPIYEPDGINSWRLRINPGMIFVPSGAFTGSEVAYKLSNQYITSPFPITNVVPSYISDDIIKVDQVPIYVDQSNFTYPLYTIETYDRTSAYLIEPSGKIAISVNGKSVPELKILSIDTEKGYLQLNKSLLATDQIELDYYLDPTGHIVVTNLELNPKNTGVLMFHISGYLDGLGMAMRPYNSSDLDTELVYLYDPTESESTRSCYSIPPVGETGIVLPWSGESFVTLCELNLNRLSKDMVKVTDARRITSIEDSKLAERLNLIQVSGLDLHEPEWYSDKGFYDGEPLAFGNTVIIHVPSGIFYNSRSQWIASMEDSVNDSLEATEKGTREFNFYLDQVIKRYISAGTNYVLIPVDSSGNFMDIVRLDY